MKAIAYIRGTQESLELQQKEVIHYADYKGYQIEKWFVDDTGTAAEQVQLDKLIDYADSHPNSTILLARFDRISRDPTKYLQVKRRLEKSGAKIIGVLFVGISDSACDKGMVELIERFTEFKFGEDRSRRIKMGIAARKARLAQSK